MTMPHRKPRDASPDAVFEHIDHLIVATLERAQAQSVANRAVLYAAALIRIRAALPEEPR